MTNYKRTAAWLKACGKEPGNGLHLSTAIGVDIEETVELLECLRVDSDGWQRVLERAVIDLRYLANAIKTGKRLAHWPNHLAPQVLDAICDREVTGNGVAYMAGFDKDAADREVLASNDSKLENGRPVILPGGKIGKGRNYTAPELQRFAGAPS